MGGGGSEEDRKAVNDFELLRQYKLKVAIQLRQVEVQKDREGGAWWGGFQKKKLGRVIGLVDEFVTAHFGSIHMYKSECMYTYVYLQHTATHCNTLQHAVTRCNSVQHTIST